MPPSPAYRVSDAKGPVQGKRVSGIIAFRNKNRTLPWAFPPLSAVSGDGIMQSAQR